MPQPPQDSLHPVILQTSAACRELAPRQRAAELSACARRAVTLSAQALGVELGVLRQDPGGAPLASHGLHWSVAHKPGYAAGVVARQPVGIDLEEIQLRSEALDAQIVPARERALFPLDADPALRFCRCWTAKEAALKSQGLTLTALERCCIVAVPDADHLVLQLDGRRLLVESHAFSGHLAALTCVEPGVGWIQRDDPAPGSG